MAHDERRVSDFWDCTGGNNRFVNMCYPSSKERNDSESDSEIGRASATTTSKESTEPGVELVTSLVTAAQVTTIQAPRAGLSLRLWGWGRCPGLPWEGCQPGRSEQGCCPLSQEKLPPHWARIHILDVGLHPQCAQKTQDQTKDTSS